MIGLLLYVRAVYGMCVVRSDQGGYQVIKVRTEEEM